jgi:hypothetical protein
LCCCHARYNAAQLLCASKGEERWEGEVLEESVRTRQEKREKHGSPENTPTRKLRLYNKDKLARKLQAKKIEELI